MSLNLPEQHVSMVSQHLCHARSIIHFDRNRESQIIGRQASLRLGWTETCWFVVVRAPKRTRDQNLVFRGTTLARAQSRPRTTLPDGNPYPQPPRWTVTHVVFSVLVFVGCVLVAVVSLFDLPM